MPFCSTNERGRRLKINLVLEYKTFFFIRPNKVTGQSNHKKKKMVQGFPGDAVVEFTYQCRRQFNPWSGKSLQVVKQSSPCATTIGVCALEPGILNFWAHKAQLPKPACPRAHTPQLEKPRWWEARALQLEWLLLASTWEKPTQQQRPRTAKNK